MPYRKIYRKIKPKRQSALKIAKKALRATKALSQDIENQTLSFTPTQITFNDVVSVYCEPTSTTDNVEHFNLKYIECYFKMACGDFENANYRIDLVCDKMPDQTGTLDYEKMYKVVSHSTSPVVWIPDYEYKERFKLIKTIRGRFTADLQTHTHYFKKYIKGRIDTKASGGFAAAEITKNAYYVLMWTDAPTGATNYPTYIYNINVVGNTS